MGASGRILYGSHEDAHVLRFEGDIRYPLAPAVGRFVRSLLAASEPKGICIDLTETTMLDSTILGQLARIATAVHTALGRRVVLVSDQPDINTVLASMGLCRLFDLVDCADADCPAPVTPLDAPMPEQADLARVILAAHRALMALNEDNRAEFADLVELLERQAKTAAAPP